MLLLDDKNQYRIIEDINSPTDVTHFWVLDLEMKDGMKDYTLTELIMVEEIISPAVEIDIDGFRFVLPTTWSILIFDSETGSLDISSIDEVIGKTFKAFVFGLDQFSASAADIKVVNYHNSFVTVAPHLRKSQMLCYPISKNTWVNISNNDIYAKSLHNFCLGDIL